jgi:hypothetical protein
MSSACAKQASARLAAAEEILSDADERAWPHGCHQLLLRHQLARVVHEVLQDAIRLRPQGDGVAALPEAFVGRIEAKVAEGHVCGR